ncbi:uncharacterized protein BYT42DRAFT_552652 [Radiomyces spectabilis]|uniref:uncharacterized protein n=1 Tax=Radiomyces spectabilis TaxID=64574 RepID=UPI00221F2AEC|nr:uncharacterized protein BYT42DRAFT_552652 [Radiomyces spectabilis]KAI8393913.1 hypothetical protein BYT42DRAFT_552652 [Radiomyces spectabilis]
MDMAHDDDNVSIMSPPSHREELLDEIQFGAEEFSEEDVLPFLLQAQDIIAKLESRVIELETDLSAIHRKYEHDRHDWLVGLSQKDQYIHHLSSKLQRLEFNSKESIVLLSDMVSEESASELSEQTVTNLTLCLNYLRQAQQAATPAVDPPTAYHDEAEDLEEGELERRQAAANEWRRRQEAAAAAGDTTAHDFNATTSENWLQHIHPVDLMDGLDPSHDSIDGSDTSRPTIADNDSVQQTSGVFSTTTSVSSMTRIPSTEEDHTIPTPHPAPRTSYVPHAISALADTTFCANCRQLLTQLDQQIEQKAYLKRDLASLASALAEEEQLRVVVEQAKEAVEEDVEEITSSLFTALNQILMDEVTDRDGLVRMNRDTDGKFAGVLQAWDVREKRLKQMKELLVELDSVTHQGNSYASRIPQEDELTSSISRMSFHGRHSSGSFRFSGLSQTLVPLNAEEAIQGLSNKTVRIDGLIFDEFQKHLKMLSSASHVVMPSTPFMKRVMTEDIDPCLFQNAGSSWWKSPWFKRKLIDAIAKNKCEIQTWSGASMSTFSSSSASSTSTSPCASHISMASSAPGTPIVNQPPPMPPKSKCTCCGLLRVCEFRMRLHSTQPPTSNATTMKQQPWLPIDRFCRDRLVAVCDFYSFISHLRQGLMQSTPPMAMFKQCLHFRRRMALAKVGSMALFDEDPRNIYYQKSSSKRRSRSSKRESIVLDHSGSGSDTGSIVSVSDIQGIDGTSQIVIVH